MTGGEIVDNHTAFRDIVRLDYTPAINHNKCGYAVF